MISSVELNILFSNIPPACSSNIGYIVFQCFSVEHQALSLFIRFINSNFLTIIFDTSSGMSILNQKSSTKLKGSLFHVRKHNVVKLCT